MMRGPKFYLALWLSKSMALAIDLIAKGRGTNLPGALALRIDPLFLNHIRGIDPEKTIFLTGTNGKSTTTNLLNRALTKAGYCVISNLDGANMTAGVAVPLLRNCSLGGKLRCDYVVMETDERYVARIRQQIPAKYLCITNIQKDQVQRNGEPNFIYEKIREAIHPDMTIFVNHDEPNTASMEEAGAERVIRYGVASHQHSFQKEHDFFSVSMPCPKCHSGVSFDRYNLDNMGEFRCPVCGFSNETKPDYLAENVSLEEKHFDLNGTTYPFHCNMPEFLYSYTLAASVSKELGIEDEAIAKAFDQFKGLRTRRADHLVDDWILKFYKMKQENAEALQSIVNSIAEDHNDKVILFSCEEYIWLFPPYLNVCFMFDCDFSHLKDSGINRWVCLSTATGHISALRFLYDGFDPHKLDILPNSSKNEIVKELATLNCDNVYLMEEDPFWVK